MISCNKIARIIFEYNILSTSNIIWLAYIEKQDVNIITVDWSESASWKVYPLPAYMTQQVGTIIAHLIDHLVNNSYVSLEDVHIIGHSLGSHVAGASGAAVATGRVARITGKLNFIPSLLYTLAQIIYSQGSVYLMAQYRLWTFIIYKNIY